MDTEKYNRSISLLCPTCGCADFETSGSSPLVKCANCGLELTKDDLVARNQEHIQAHTDDIKREVAADLQTQLTKSLRQAFRGSKHIKMR